MKHPTKIDPKEVARLVARLINCGLVNAPLAPIFLKDLPLIDELEISEATLTNV